MVTASLTRALPRWWALALILVLAAALRLYDLNGVPTELIVDELDLYNSAYSIVTTGHDVDGSLKPFLYSRFTRNPPVYGFAALGSSLVFGKSPFALRLPAAVGGVVTVALLYALGYALSRRRGVGAWAALFAAIAPIFIQFSRTAWEPSCELPFLLGGVYVQLRALQRFNESGDSAVLWRRLPWAALLFAVTCYTYMTGWFYAVIIGGTLLLAYLTPIVRNRSALAAVVASLAALALMAWPALSMVFFDPLTAGKAARISTFHDGINATTLLAFCQNYLSHFRISYLAFTGDPRPGLTWRYLNGFGALYWWIVALAAGGALVAREYVRSLRDTIWLYVWALAYPLAASLTMEAPNAPRTLAGIPALCLFAAFATVMLLDGAKQLRPRVARIASPALAALLVALAVSSTSWFAYDYFTAYVHRNSNAWDSGTRAMFSSVESYRARFERVCFNVLPASYGIDTYVRYYDAGLPYLTQLDAPACYAPGTLIVTDGAHPLQRMGFHYLATVQDVDGYPFAILFLQPRS